MTKTKKLIPIILLFIAVGLAVVSTTLSLEGSTSIASNVDDFKVYFSKVLINGEEDEKAVVDQTTISYSKTLTSIGEGYTITYDVTNASKIYDAEIEINCTSGDDYLSVTNTFDDSILEARTTRTGTLVVKKAKSNSQTTEKNYEITCSLKATATSRSEKDETTVPDAVEGYQFAIGNEVSIGDEKFNVISFSDTTVSLLAQYNISDTEPYKQTSTQIWTAFSTTSGWEYTPGPKEIDVQTWGGDVKTLLNYYISYLNTTYNLDVTGDLITVSELGNLGCTVPTDHARGDGGYTCIGSKYSDWLINNQYFWTRSAYAGDPDSLWILNHTGDNMYFSIYYNSYGVRPVITISEETLSNYLQ